MGDEAFRKDLDDVLSSAEKAGVTRFLVPGIDLSSSIEAVRLSGRRRGVFAAVGIHPNELNDDSYTDIEKIQGILIDPGVAAVGETGMDFYRDVVGKDLQREFLAGHAELARAFGLTLVVHSRGAEEEVLEVLGDDLPVPVVLHCYTGDAVTARKAVDRGFYIGFAGPITYRGNDELRKLAAGLPGDRILAETDSPYLAPSPVRGSRNEPANLVHVVEALAETTNMELHAMVERLTENSESAFRLGARRRTALVYRLGDTIYMNITGKCDNHCRFCIRDRTDGIGGYRLRHDVEPDDTRLRSIISFLPPGNGRELVFCGYGEPTMRPVLLEELAEAASGKGYMVRLNTNGTCLARMSGEDVVKMLAPFHRVSVSLNASSEKEYARLCRPSLPNAWERLLEFVELAGKSSEVRLTAVGYPGLDMKAVKRLAESMGFPFRVR